MPDRKALRSPKATPGLVISIFVLLMTGCVLFASGLKINHNRNVELERGRIDIQNLSHSLAEHATNTIQAPDIVMNGMADLLRYQDPLPERFNKYLADTADALPQVREIGVLNSDGFWRYSSTGELPTYNNSDRPYFEYHRDNADRNLRISEPFYSRYTGRLTILLSRRITRADGTFGGVVFAAIDTEYLRQFYGKFNLGRDGAITLVREDGIALMRTPTFEPGTAISNAEMIRTKIRENPTGFNRTTSPFDGITKYFGYEKASGYPLYVTVAISEAEVLARWWAMLGSDALITGAQLGVVILLAAMLSLQFRRRVQMERTLRQREAYFRLLTENIADVVLLLDGKGKLNYVSNSVEVMLGHRPSDLIGKSCFDLVHPDDRDLVRKAAAAVTAPAGNSVIFRTFRTDRSIAWVETHFRLTDMPGEKNRVGFVGVLRDVTERKRMEDELTKLNGRLAQLATTDGLTGLPNRRTFDGFLRREFETSGAISVILIDIDHFKSFNDTYGHQAGDRCLQSVAQVIGEATENTRALSARYGGEEFVVVLPGVSEDGAIKVAEAILLKVRARAMPHAGSPRNIVTISAGIASKATSTLGEAELVGEADVALYEAKRAGRNQVVCRSAMEAQYHPSPAIVSPALAPGQSEAPRHIHAASNGPDRDRAS